MQCLSICCFVILILAPGLTYAQDSTATAARGESQEEGGIVQVGASTKGDVTTGTSSGGGPPNPVVAPEAPGFALAPRWQPFQGPGLLEVHTPERLRCELISDDNARRRCEIKNARLNRGGAHE